MLQELTLAGSLLSSALDRYLEACVAVQKSYLGRGSFAAVPPELASRVDSEAQLVTALDVKLRKAKSVILWARNCSTTLVPIHTLPRELLARIFLYISRMQYNHDYNSGLHMKSPEVVSHICSRWREIALNLPHFWSIIRLPLGEHLAKVARAVAFAERANSLPLHLQLYDENSYQSSGLGSITQLSGFAPIISPRIRSLHLALQSDRPPFLRQCLEAACKFGLKTLITSSHNSRLAIDARHEIGFFDVTTNLPPYLSSHSYAIQAVTPSHGMASIDTLVLKGLYPFWTSTAYHGLVELRLNQHEFVSVKISESHLVGILRASPALCFLEFNLEIVESLPTNALVSPVRLDCLKSLVVGQSAGVMLGTFLRWLFPGPNPLQLSLSDEDGFLLQLPDTSPSDGIALLFSNVREIYARGLSPSQIVFLIDRCPNLITLALQGSELISDLGEPAHPIRHHRLESIFVLGCIVNQRKTLSDLIVNSPPTLQNVLFWRCSRSDDYSVLHAQDLNYPAGICPNVGVIDYNPIQGWAVFD